MTKSKDLNKDVIDEIVRRWTETTSEHEEEPMVVPVKVLLGEATDLAGLIDTHYLPKKVRDGQLPGLESVVAFGQLSVTTASEIRELVVAIAAIHNEMTVSVDKADDESVVRGEELELELRSALAFVLEDGRHEKGEQQLAQLRTEHSPIVTHDGLALALEGYALLAEQYLELLGAISFSAEHIAEARAVAQGLRQRSADRLAGDTVEEHRNLLGLRNRLLAALCERLRLTRRAFRYVFRAYPAIIKRSGSEYERARRRHYAKPASEAEAKANGAAAALDARGPSA